MAQGHSREGSREDTVFLCLRRSIPVGRAPRRSDSGSAAPLWVEDYATPGFSSDEVTTRIEVARSKDLAYQRGTYVSTQQDNVVK